MQVATALSKAYQDETRERAVHELLKPLDLDLQQFFAHGPTIFQGDYLTRLYEIEQFDLGITFLVAGFYGVLPSIFVVERRGMVKYFNKPGFCAIGSGGSLGKDYEPLWKPLAAIDAIRNLQSGWSVRYANTTPLHLANYCARFMDANDRLLVTEMPDDFAMMNLIAKAESGLKRQHATAETQHPGRHCSHWSVTIELTDQQAASAARRLRREPL